jgi:hypothetical protein
MLAFRLAMIQHEPAMTRKTISSPKARARMLFVDSGPLPTCRKKTRRHDERGDRRQDREPEPRRVR